MLKRSKNDLLNQASEHHVGTNDRDNVTGAPVIELEYKYSYNTVLEEVNMATY